MNLECSDKSLIESIYMDGGFTTQPKIPGFWSGGTLSPDGRRVGWNGADMLELVGDLHWSAGMLETTPGGLEIASLTLGRHVCKEDLRQLMTRCNERYNAMINEASVWYARSIMGNEVFLHVEWASPEGVFRRDELPFILSDRKVDTVYAISQAEKNNYRRVVSVMPIEEWYYPQRYRWVDQTFRYVRAQDIKQGSNLYLKSLSRLLVEGGLTVMENDVNNHYLWDKSTEFDIGSKVAEALWTPAGSNRHIDYATEALSYVENERSRSLAEKYIRGL